jgi:ornithine cyclodeaminase/alanine dehydrogenase-like protein (mu-crystallin family)
MYPAARSAYQNPHELQGMTVLLLNAHDVRKALPIREAIDAMKSAFAALSNGSAVVPHRTTLSIPSHAGTSLVMSSYTAGETPENEALALKVVSLFDGNCLRGLARIQATVLVLQPDTGQICALLEGATLTAIRTAAASGAATDLLARPESKTLAVLGAGVQAQAHVEAVCAIRPIESVHVFSPSPNRVRSMVQEFAARREIPARFIPAASAAEALKGADIVCTTTTSATPVFDDADLDVGAHINAVGSYKPEAAEVPPETVVRAKVVADSREAAWLEAGDLIQPLLAGRIGRAHIHAELGEIVLGLRAGRTNAQEITLFKSVGIAVQDAFAARMAVAGARRLGLGQEIEW